MTGISRLRRKQLQTRKPLGRCYKGLRETSSLLAVRTNHLSMSASFVLVVVMFNGLLVQFTISNGDLRFFADRCMTRRLCIKTVACWARFSFEQIIRCLATVITRGLIITRPLASPNSLRNGIFNYRLEVLRPAPREGWTYYLYANLTQSDLKKWVSVPSFCEPVNSSAYRGFIITDGEKI